MTGYWDVLVRNAFEDRDEHRPVDKAAMRCAAVELRQRGLTAEDVADALRISVEAVLELLEVAE